MGVYEIRKNGSGAEPRDVSLTLIDANTNQLADLDSLAGFYDSPSSIYINRGIPSSTVWIADISRSRSKGSQAIKNYIFGSGGGALSGGQP